MHMKEPPAPAADAVTESSRRKPKRRLFIILSALLGLGVSVLAGEVAMRFYVASRGWTPNCYATGDAFFVPHPTAGHALRPNLELKSTAYDVAVNARGFRGPAIAPQKLPQSIRIVVLGGSSVFGYLVPEGKDSCRLLETSLQGAGIAAEVINAGVPGFNITQCRELYLRDGAPLLPDYVILYLGWNDIPLLLSEDPTAMDRTPPAPGMVTRVLSGSPLYGFLRYRLLPRHSPRFTPPESVRMRVTAAGATAFQRELDQLLRAIESSGATPIISTQVSAACEGCLGLNEFLGDSESQRAANQQIGRWLNQCLRTTAREGNYPLIDCAATVKCDRSTLGDAIHLTAHGHEQVASQWHDIVISLVAAPRE
jgi:lysophospholipase L1-like esterase